MKLRALVPLAALMVVPFVPLAARATKPCAPNPCGGTSDSDPLAGFGAPQSCQSASTFIVVGRIEKVKKVVHDIGSTKITGASFELVVETFEKGGGESPPARIAMESRWCFNAPIVLEPKPGKVRVFGRDPLSEKGNKSYYAIEPYTGPKKWSSATPKASASASASASVAPSASVSVEPTSPPPAVSASESIAPSPSAAPTPSTNPPPRVDPPARGCSCTTPSTSITEGRTFAQPFGALALLVSALVIRRRR